MFRHQIFNLDLIQPTKLAILSIRKIRRILENGCNDFWLKNETFLYLMLHFLRCHGNEMLQMEASWIFTNIAAGNNEQTNFIVKAGVIPPTIDLLSSTNPLVLEQAIWTLGNIIGDSTEYRDIIVEMGIIEKLVRLNINSITHSLKRTMTWVFVNLVRCKAEPLKIDAISKLVPKLDELVLQDDEISLIDAMWALTYITDCGNDYIQMVIDHNVIQHVVPALLNRRHRVQLAAVRFLGNIATGNDSQTQVLIDNNVLNSIRFLLMHTKEHIRKTALWCLSNISAGSNEQIQAIFSAALLPRIADNLLRTDLRTVREAVLTMQNLISAATNEQIVDIIDTRAVTYLYNLMQSNDLTITQAAHDGLKTLFSKGGLLIESYPQVYNELEF